MVENRVIYPEVARLVGVPEGIATITREHSEGHPHARMRSHHLDEEPAVAGQQRCLDPRVEHFGVPCGVEPEDVRVEVTAGGELELHSEQRAELKGEHEVLADEWSPGPYHGTVALPAPVDGEHANVTYNNGVLVVVLPVADRTRPARLTLESVSPARGERVGHAGRDLHQTSTADHRAAKAAAGAPQAPRGR